MDTVKGIVSAVICLACLAGPGCRQATLSDAVAIGEHQNWVVLRDATELNSTWIPAEAQIPGLMRGARVYLLQTLNRTSHDRPQDEIQQIKSEFLRREIQEILSAWDHYVCQAVGHSKQGRKLIHLSFLLPAAFEPGLDWRKEVVQVEDGGMTFWQIDYDPEDQRFLNFHPSGHG